MEWAAAVRAVLPMLGYRGGLAAHAEAETISTQLNGGMVMLMQNRLKSNLTMCGTVWSCGSSPSHSHLADCK